MNLSLLEIYLLESFILLEDKRGFIKKLGFSQEFADLIHGIEPRYSLWIARDLKDRIPDNLVPQIGDPKTDRSIWTTWGKGVLNDLEWAKSKEIDPTKIKDLSQKRREFEEIEASEQAGEVMMKFPNGFYWINLKTSRCEIEGKAMQHCGADYAGDLWSLRDKNKKSRVTLAVDEDGKIHQAKGKQNTKPSKKYHKYIVPLLVKGLKIELDNPDDFSIFDLTSKELEALYKETGNEQYNIPPLFLDHKKVQSELINKVGSSLFLIKKMTDNIVDGDEEEIEEHFGYTAREMYQALDAIHQDMRLHYIALIKLKKFQERFKSAEEARESITNLINVVKDYYEKNRDFFI